VTGIAVTSRHRPNAPQGRDSGRRCPQSPSFADAAGVTEARGPLPRCGHGVSWRICSTYRPSCSFIRIVLVDTGPCLMLSSSKGRIEKREGNHCSTGAVRPAPRRPRVAPADHRPGPGLPTRTLRTAEGTPAPSPPLGGGVPAQRQVGSQSPAFPPRTLDLLLPSTSPRGGAFKRHP